MAAIFQFQSRATLRTIAANLVQEVGNSNPIFQYVFPIRERNQVMLRWRVDDNIGGQMALRGAGGAPVKVDPVGSRYYETNPGVFGEHMDIDEIELLKLGANIPADTAVYVSVNDQIRDYQRTLLMREQNRMRVMGYTVARTGAIAIPLPNAGIGYSENYTITTRTVAPLWTNPSTSTPLADFQLNHQLYGIGTSTNFQGGAVALLNTYTKNLLFNNRNQADWGGRRVDLGTLMGMGDYDQIRTQLELPRLVVWDGGHTDASGAFVLDIPNGEIILVGQRPDGELPGEFSMTYNAVNNGPGAYTEVFDFSRNERKEIPPRIEVHAGFNGGLVLTRPSQLLRMVVG